MYKHNHGITQIVCRQGHATTLNSSIALNVAKARYHEVSKKYVNFFAFDYAHFGKGVTSSFRVGFKSEEDAASFLTIFNENCKCKCGNGCEICVPQQATTPSTKLEEVASNDEGEDTAKPTIAKSVTDLCSDSEEDSESEEDSDSEEDGEIPSDADEGSEASDRSYYLEDDFANSQAMPDFDDLAIINDLHI